MRHRSQQESCSPYSAIDLASSAGGSFGFRWSGARDPMHAALNGATMTCHCSVARPTSKSDRGIALRVVFTYALLSGSLIPSH